jgi:hypothetical protein
MCVVFVCWLRLESVSLSVVLRALGSLSLPSILTIHSVPIGALVDCNSFPSLLILVFAFLALVDCKLPLHLSRTPISQPSQAVFHPTCQVVAAVPIVEDAVTTRAHFQTNGSFPCPPACLPAFVLDDGTY